MTEETVAPVGQPVTETIATPAEHEPAGNTNERPEGWEQVDLTELPPEIRGKYEARINRLYGQVKRSESVMRELAENQRRLQGKIDNWEVGQVQQRTSGRLQELQRDYKVAFERGDADKAWAIQRELTELQATSTRPPVRQAEEPKQPSGGLAVEEAEAIGEWAQARPYARDGNEWQPWTASQLNELYVHPQWRDRPIEDKLEEVDRRFRAQTKPAGAAVLDGQGGRAQARGTKLTNEQQAVARMLFPAMKPADAYAKYAKGL